jgi:hypothetical protein
MKSTQKARDQLGTLFWCSHRLEVGIGISGLASGGRHPSAMGALVLRTLHPFVFLGDLGRESVV